MFDLLVWFGIAFGVLGGLLLLLAAIGLFLKKGHVVSRSMKLNQPPEAVWQAVRNIAEVPTWYKTVERVERIDDQNGQEIWREIYTGDYSLLLKTTESTPPSRLVRTLADEKGPFTGRWEFDIAPHETGSRITLTEFGEIANPFFRFMARMFMKPQHYIELYLESLAGKFGEKPTIEK
jgi:uncharacterized protein YndB with AHSA1/START domain